MSRHLAVSGNRYQQGHLRQVERMLRVLAGVGFTLDIHFDFYDYLAGTPLQFPPGTVRVEKLPAEAEAVISVGGDGTFLHTAAWVGESGIPIVGINTGHLGYLAHFGIEDIDALAGSLVEKNLARQERMLLQLNVVDDTSRPPLFALNEIAILKDDTSSMIEARTHVGNDFLADYRADGLIIATATGSTGYNMSAGGPLMQPTLDTIILTPLAPHSLTLRPLVLDGNSVITAVTDSRSGRYRVSVDGDSFTLPAGTAICISRAPHPITLLVRPDCDFSFTLRRKLGWAL